MPEQKNKRGPRYTPVSRRQDRPNAILWLIRNHAELKDSQIMRLVGTTKSTIQSIRERSHWNASNLSPLDPVTLGLCSQIDLDLQVAKAAKEKPAPSEHDRVTLLPASVTTAPAQTPMPEETRTPAASQVAGRCRRRIGVRQAEEDRRDTGRRTEKSTPLSSVRAARCTRTEVPVAPNCANLGILWIARTAGMVFRSGMTTSLFNPVVAFRH